MGNFKFISLGEIFYAPTGTYKIETLFLEIEYISALPYDEVQRGWSLIHLDKVTRPTSYTWDDENLISELCKLIRYLTALPKDMREGYYAYWKMHNRGMLTASEFGF